MRKREREKEGKRECASETSTGRNGAKEIERMWPRERVSVRPRKSEREERDERERVCDRERKRERVRGRERKEKLHYPLK